MNITVTTDGVTIEATSDEASKLAYACDVLEGYASSDDFRRFAEETAYAIRSAKFDFANPPDVVEWESEAEADARSSAGFNCV